MTTNSESPAIISRNAPYKCKICGGSNGIIQTHYPPMIFRSGDFEAPPWFAHEKFYCPHCRFMWTDVFDKLDAEAYGCKYLENNYDHQRRPTESRMAFAPSLLRTLINLNAGRRFLDYGCGYNHTYIYELRSRGFDLWGCDISPAINYSRYITQIPFDRFPDDFFDAVYSIDVMEHFADPVNDFSDIARMVKPGGYLLFNTISLDSYIKGEFQPPDDPMVWAPWHCSIFSTDSAERLAELSGLDFKGAMRTNSDTGLAFLFRKPGPLLRRKFDYCYKLKSHIKLLLYEYYFRSNYRKPDPFPGNSLSH